MNDSIIKLNILDKDEKKIIMKVESGECIRNVQ